MCIFSPSVFPGSQSNSSNVLDYAPHSFSVCTSKEKLTVAKHLYASVQLLSHSSCTGGELVHVYFLATIQRVGIDVNTLLRQLY
jgi:hypothetical protein